MKVERIVTESVAVSNSLTADKAVKEEKKTLTTDAVTFERDKNKQNQQQEKQKQKADTNEPEKSGENLVFIEETIGIGKKLDVLA